MKRAFALVALALVVTLGVVAGPALSSKPYRPEPVDFSMAGGATSGDPDPGGGVVSESMRSPERFTMVGMTWARGSLEPDVAIRTRVDGGEWTRWAAVYSHAEDGPDPGMDERRERGMSNPAWAGEADWVQYRSSEPLEGVELHFVNTAGTATATDRVTTALRGAVSAAVTSIGGLLSAKAAAAADGQPKMVSRAGWGAEDCKPRTGPLYGEVKAAYVHHTVNLNDYSREEAPQIVLGICRYHRNTNGWNDIGYNFLVDRFGTIYEGRAGGVDAAVVGAQAEGFNSHTTGVANIGTFSDVKQTTAALEAMARLIRWKLPLHGYPTTGTAVLESAGGASNRYPAGARVRVKRVLGHRDTNATECPGNALYAQLPELRSLVGEVAPHGVATDVTAAVDARRSTIDYGGQARILGALETVDGAPVAGQPVLVQALVGGRWRDSSTPVTAPDGSFATTTKPKVTRALRVRFAGSGDLRSSVTPSLTVSVRPVLRLSALPHTATAGERVRLRGRVRPAMRRVYQVLQVERDGRFRTAGVKALTPGARGYFRGSFVPADGGRYRAYVVGKANRLRARGVSEKVEIEVRHR